MQSHPEDYGDDNQPIRDGHITQQTKPIMQIGLSHVKETVHQPTRSSWGSPISRYSNIMALQGTNPPVPPLPCRTTSVENPETA
ncbi:uncharacterized [Tachysurus ichikawai]